MKTIKTYAFNYDIYEVNIIYNVKYIYSNRNKISQNVNLAVILISLLENTA